MYLQCVVRTTQFSLEDHADTHCRQLPASFGDRCRGLLDDQLVGQFFLKGRLTTPRPAVGPTQPNIRRVSGSLYPGGKAAGTWG